MAQTVPVSAELVTYIAGDGTQITMTLTQYDALKADIAQSERERNARRVLLDIAIQNLKNLREKL